MTMVEQIDPQPLLQTLQRSLESLHRQVASLKVPPEAQHSLNATMEQMSAALVQLEQTIHPLRPNQSCGAAAASAGGEGVQPQPFLPAFQNKLSSPTYQASAPLHRELSHNASNDAVVASSNPLLKGIDGQLEVTDSKYVETLIQSQRFIEQVTDASPQLLYLVDIQRFTNVYVNRQVENILGYSAVEVQEKGPQFFADLIHVEDQDYVQTHFSHLLAGPEGEVFEVEYRARHADGTYRWLQSREVVFARDPQGKATHLLGMAIDISHRKEIESQLQASQEQLRQIVDHIEGCFFLRSIGTGEVLYISVGYERLYGRSRQELTHSSDAWLEIVHPEDRDRIRAKMVAERQGQAFFDDEYRFLMPDGSVRWLWNLSFPIRNEAGQIYRIAGFNRDITERKRIETALRESEARFRSTSEQSAVGICHCDQTGKFLWVNPALCQLLGYSSTELLVKTFLDITHPGDFPENGAQAWAALNAFKQPACSFTKRYLRKDGTVLWAYVTLSIVRDQAGMIHYLTGIVQDISPQKQMEIELRNSLHEKELLLAEVHHRVKNNLQIISSLLELQANRTQDAAAYDALMVSQNRVIAMALIHETLYQAGELAHIDFAHYIQRLTGSLFRAYGSETTLSLNLTVEACLTLASDVAISLGLILNELVTNALKHGGFQQQKGMLEIGLKSVVPHMYSLWVSHEGDCLPSDFTLEASSSMGLKLVKLLVQRINGRLTVERQHRTTFTIEFPVVPDLGSG